MTAKIVPVVIPIEESKYHSPTQAILTREQIRLVQSSFEILKPEAASFVSVFYDRLLTEHPELQHAFASVSRRPIIGQKREILLRQEDHERVMVI